MAQRGLEYPCLSWANGTLMARRCDVLVLALTSADVSCLTVPYAVDPRLTGAGRRRGRHDVRAATVPTNAGGPGDGLLGCPGSAAYGTVRPTYPYHDDGALSPARSGAGDPRRRLAPCGGELACARAVPDNR
jgi:hypothetical protein